MAEHIPVLTRNGQPPHDAAEQVEHIVVLMREKPDGSCTAKIDLVPGRTSIPEVMQYLRSNGYMDGNWLIESIVEGGLDAYHAITAQLADYRVTET